LTSRVVTPSPLARQEGKSVAPLDNQLTFMDQASFLALRARDQPQLVQWVWVYERALDFDGLERFHHNLGYGLLGRLIERSPLPFGRHRWVAAHEGPALDVAEHARPRAELGEWMDECARLPIDPELGPGWQLAVAPFTDGSMAVSLVTSHCLVDGLGCGLAIADAVNGVVNEFGYPPPHSRTRRRAMASDARQTLRGVAEVARAIRAATKLVRRQRQEFARLGGPRSVADPTAVDAKAADDADGYVTVPAITIHIDQDDWDARARALGGTSNSLFTGFAAKLGERMGRQCADDGTVRVIITASDRKDGDTHANALSFTNITVDPKQVTLDLSGVRGSIRQALKTLRETPDESLELLPLTPLTPKRAVRRLGDVLFAFADRPVTCTNIGDIDPVVGYVDGTKADCVFARGVDQKVTPQLVEQKFFLGSGRIGGKLFLTVIAYHLDAPNSKAELAALARETLAAFDLTAAII
jgi:hypothetical protein